VRDAATLGAAPTKLVSDLLDCLRSHGKLLIVTFSGDALQPHRGRAWLGGLIRTLGPMGLSERVERSSAFRLVRDELLSATQTGRRSFYALTSTENDNFKRLHSAFTGCGIRIGMAG
jgi:phenylacetic acid degradation operon negative regulatory protein